MPGPSRIRDVWAPTLDTEMRTMRALVDRYPYVAMDTEFPGVVARPIPISAWKGPSDYHYQTMRCNVDMLKVVQVGLTLADADGNFPEETSTWQFNFKFNINEDMYSPESIELLQKAGVDFQRHEEFGIEPNDFAELMITSGMVLSDETVWVSFHSGYDFGHIVNLLTGAPLPPQEDAFFDILKLWFPQTFDVKAIIKSLDANAKSGLQALADDLGILRIGPSHTAGSDSLLTAAAFFKTRALYFPAPPGADPGSSGRAFPTDEFNARLYGFGPTVVHHNAPPDSARGGATIAERDDRTGVGAHSTPLGMGGGMQPMGQQPQYAMSGGGGFMRR